MKMYQIMKQFGLASIVWLVVFVCDYAIELFRIDHTGTVVTAFGLKMDTTMTEQELSTVFSLTSRAACVYAIFVGLWMLVYLCLSLYDKKKNRRMTVLLFVYMVSVVGAVFCHEFIHWIVAKAFGMKPRLTFSYVVIPAVSYRNKGENLHNLLISISSPVLLVIVGFMVNWQLAYLIVFKVMCLANFFNLLPCTNDGQIALLSIVNLLRGGACRG